MIDFVEAVFSRGCQVRLESYLSCTPHWRAAALPSHSCFLHAKSQKSVSRSSRRVTCCRDVRWTWPRIGQRCVDFLLVGICILPSRCALPISLCSRSRSWPILARVQAFLHFSGPQSRTRLGPNGVERVRGDSRLVLNATWSLSWARCRCLLRSCCVWQVQSRLRSSSSSTRTSPVEFRGSQSGATSAHRKRASWSSPLIEHRSHPPQTLRCGKQLTNTHPTLQ